MVQLPFTITFIMDQKGFTEFDTFRSNQIREGMITRDEALGKLKYENQPRWQSLKEYAGLIGFSLDELISVVEGMRNSYAL